MLLPVSYKAYKTGFFGLYFLFISTYQLLPHEMSHMKCFDELSDLRCRIKCLINVCPTQYCEFCSWIRLFSLAFLINIWNWLQSITSKISMYFLLDDSVNCTPLMWFHLSLCLFQFHCHYICHLLLSKDWCLLFHNSIQLFTCNSTDITYGVSKLPFIF